MITTIQLNDSVKNELDRLKEDKETYEQVIISLIKFLGEQKRKQKELLIEGYKKMAEDSLRINEEFNHIDTDEAVNKDWVWDGDL